MVCLDIIKYKNPKIPKVQKSRVKSVQYYSRLRYSGVLFYYKKALFMKKKQVSLKKCIYGIFILSFKKT